MEVAHGAVTAKPACVSVLEQRGSAGGEARREAGGHTCGSGGTKPSACCSSMARMSGNSALMAATPPPPDFIAGSTCTEATSSAESPGLEALVTREVSRTHESALLVLCVPCGGD